MTADKLIKLTGFIIGQNNQPFEWGRRDCNTFIAQCNDILTGNKTAQKIINQYDSLKSAIRFQRQFLSAGQYLYQQGWRKIDPASSPLRDGDVLVCDGQHFSRAHIFLGGAVWSVHEHAGVCAVGVEYMPPYTTWRLE